MQATRTTPQTSIDWLFTAGLLKQEQVFRLRRFQRETGFAPVKILLNFGYLSRKQYERVLATNGHMLIAIREEAYTMDVVSQLDLRVADRFLGMPLRIENGHVVVAMADPTDEMYIALVRDTFNLPLTILPASDLDIIWLSHKLLGEPYVKKAVFDLVQRDPESSALVTFTNSQLVVIFSLIAVVVTLLCLNFVDTSITINVLMSTFFLISIGFKLFLALVGSRFELFQAVTKEEVAQVRNEDLPVYTIQLPVYKEDKLIRKLIWNLQNLDYPGEKLDIKLLIEEDDDKTLNAVRALDFPANFEVIVVPFHMPKTKPKACNYGLHFSRGEFLTIYDAEDIPDADQLKDRKSVV